MSRSQRRYWHLLAVDALGGQCECGEADPEQLELDHIHNNGGVHRLLLKGEPLARWFIEAGQPPNIVALLCRPCHRWKTKQSMSHSEVQMSEYMSQEVQEFSEIPLNEHESISKSTPHQKAARQKPIPTKVGTVQIWANVKTETQRDLQKLADRSGQTLGQVIDLLLHGFEDTIGGLHLKVDTILAFGPMIEAVIESLEQRPGSASGETHQPPFDPFAHRRPVPQTPSVSVKPIEAEVQPKRRFWGR